MFESAYKAKLEAKRGQIEEWLTLKVIEKQTNYPTEKADKIIPIVREDVIENISELQKIGKVEEKDVTETSTEENFKVVDIYFYVTVDEDIYKVNLKEQKFIGQVGKMIPTIRLDNIYSKTSEITVKVSTQNNEGGKLEYFIKSEDENNYIKKDTLDSEINQEYTYKGLMQNKKYSIKIVAESKGKQTAQVFGEASTGNIEVATGGTYTPSTWTNKKVTVTLPTKSGYETRYTTDKTIPTVLSTKYTNEFEVSKNTMINYAFSDGTNVGEVGTLNVINIDTVGPVIETIRSAVSSAISTEAKLSTTVNDANSGLSKIVWQWGTSTSFGSSKTDTYTEMNGSTTGPKESITATCELKGLNAGTKYYARVIVYDVAGNPSTSSTIEFTTGAGVAQVGDTIYTSVQNAVNAISSSETVKMLSNTTISTTVSIAAGKNITLNLNGKTIAGTNNVITIRNAGYLTITGNGTISQIDANAIYNDSSGTVVFNSGTINGTSGWTIYNEGNFNFNGGNLQTTGSNAGVAVMNLNRFTINGGSITSVGYGIVDRGTNARLKAQNATLQITGSDKNVIHHEAGKATFDNCVLKTVQSTSTSAAVCNFTSSYTDVIIKSRASNYGISGNVFGKAFATTNVSAGQSQENMTIFNTGYSSLCWATWTNVNGQDDLTWETTSSSGTHTYTVKKANHNNETGTYTVHIYDDSRTVFIGGIELVF